MIDLRYTLSGAIARVTLPHPEKGNPISVSMLEALHEQFRRAEAGGARVFVLGSAGPCFCSGGDLEEIAAMENLSRGIDDAAAVFHRLISEFLESSLIVVAAVQGVTVGGGLSLVAAADIVIASEQATFTSAYTGVGLSFDGGLSMISHSIGVHRALRMVLLNDTMSAAEAFDAGLVARVVPEEDLEAAVDAVSQALASGSQPALAAAKQLVRRTAEPAPDSAMRREAVAMRELARGADAREGISAFNEKRRPVYPAPEGT